MNAKNVANRRTACDSDASARSPATNSFGATPSDAGALWRRQSGRVQIPIAQNLEKMGKFAGAIAFYREIARQAEGTEEGRLAATRIAELTSRPLNTD